MDTQWSEPVSRRRKPATPQPSQIFVDDSGRRSRRVRLAGIAVTVLCAAYMGIVVTGLSQTGVGPLLAVPAGGNGLIAGFPDSAGIVPGLLAALAPRTAAVPRKAPVPRKAVPSRTAAPPRTAAVPRTAAAPRMAAVPRTAAIPAAASRTAAVSPAAGPAVPRRPAGAVRTATGTRPGSF